MVPLLLLTACLERVSGEPVPLDPRYYAGGSEPGEESRHDPNAQGTGDGAWVGYEGETVKLTGVVRSDNPGPVQIDLNQPDPDAPGGQVRAGAVHLHEPGTFEIDVPATVRVLRVQAFQDPEVDGPSEADPFAEVIVQFDPEQPPEPVELALVVGARGAAGDGAPAAGPEPQTDPFPAGPRVSLRGKVTAAQDLPVKVDVFRVDPAVEGGRTFLFKREVEDGAFEIRVPPDLGEVELEAYQDLTGNGPSEDDPKGRVAPFSVGDEDRAGLDIELP